MELIITETFRELCDIDDENIGTLSTALMEKLRIYTKPKPTLKSLLSSSLYNKLATLGTILHTTCDDYHAVVRYADLNRSAIVGINGYRYGTEYHYPMYVATETFGDNFLLISLVETYERTPAGAHIEI
jgi:hypothetical protein